MQIACLSGKGSGPTVTGISAGTVHSHAIFRSAIFLAWAISMYLVKIGGFFLLTSKVIFKP